MTSPRELWGKLHAQQQQVGEAKRERTFCGNENVDVEKGLNKLADRKAQELFREKHKGHVQQGHSFRLSEGVASEHNNPNLQTNKEIDRITKTTNNCKCFDGKPTL
ncbi:hypothetical protein O6H91_Y427500 [Diphasiastrum complanatum]|nr:hypothetical protein O6H91_Y427500 [Diphasiastrum complanatum]